MHRQRRENPPVDLPGDLEVLGASDGADIRVLMKAALKKNGAGGRTDGGSRTEWKDGVRKQLFGLLD